LGQALHSGAEIVMIVVAIFGLWKYIVVPLWESAIVPLWNWWHKSFNTKEKLILLDDLLGYPIDVSKEFSKLEEERASYEA